MMKNEVRTNNFHSRLSFYHSSAAFWFCLLIILCLMPQTALGQSGRRGSRQSDAPARNSSSTKTDSTPTSTTDNIVAPKLALLVTDRYESSSVPSNVAREIFNSFTQRLRERSSAITVTIERDINRKEAAERAKAGKQAYVVWLGLQPDTPDSMETANSEYLVLNYVVFSPGSAEVKIKGRVYYHQADARALDAKDKKRQRKRPQALRQPVEETLEETGRAAADSVVAAFKEMLAS